MITIKDLIIGIIGFIFTTIGFFYVIVYSNLFTFGYSLKEYFLFMFKEFRSYFLPMGLILLAFALRKGIKK